MVEVSDYADSEAVYHLKDADRLVREAYKYKMARDRGSDTSRWPEIEAAYEFYANRPFEKLAIEGMLLAGAKDDVDIGQFAACSGGDVAVYHDLFFDVRPRLKSPGWIAARFFQGEPYGPSSSRDRVGRMHRLAWLGGKDLFECVYTGLYDDALRVKIQQQIRGILAKTSMLNALTYSGNQELNVQVLSIFLDDTHKQIAAAAQQQGGGDSDYSKALIDFLRAKPPVVADLTDPRNLSLPADEPRASSYIEAAHVVDSHV